MSEDVEMTDTSTGSGWNEATLTEPLIVEKTEERKTKPFACPHCAKSFNLANNLDFHLRLHNLTVTNNSPSYDFVNNNLLPSPSTGTPLNSESEDKLNASLPGEEEKNQLISIDSIKHNVIDQSEYITVRFLQKGLRLEEIVVYPNSVCVAFKLEEPFEALLLKHYTRPSSGIWLWHPELFAEVIPELCKMSSQSNIELLLRKRDIGRQWPSLTRSTADLPSSSASNYHRQSSSYSRSPTSSSYLSSSPSTSHHSVYRSPTYLTVPSSTYSPTKYSPTIYSGIASARSRSVAVARSSSSSELMDSGSGSYSGRYSTAAHKAIPPAAPPPPPELLTPKAKSSANLSTLAGNNTKPTCKVSPYDDQGFVVSAGYTGLRNLGNTCFLNATLQMLVNFKELQLYFSNDIYKKDINESNPLGFKGRLAYAFAEFMKVMWSGMHRAHEPTRIKELVAEKATQFANFAQHDAHEFLSFLLDGLHEDLNRVRKKPTTTTVEASGRPDREVSEEAWSKHKMRNDSIFVDLFHGQLKSRLQCPKCAQVSITFDPFVYLPVPFPKQKKTHEVVFWPIAPQHKPYKVSVTCSIDATVSEFLDALGDILNLPSDSLRLCDVEKGRFYKCVKPNHIATSEMLYVFQVLTAAEHSEEVVELTIVQRLLFRRNLERRCHYAKCDVSSGQLSTCVKCYNALYCSKDCQVNDWNRPNGHKIDCGLRCTGESVGQPFIISIPRSQLTYDQLILHLNARCLQSVQVFQPPVDPRCSEGTDSSLDGSSLSSEREDSSSDFSSPVKQMNDRVAKRPSSVREKSRLDAKLFILRKLNPADSVMGEIIKATDQLTGLTSGSVISLNWMNKKQSGMDFLTVETRKDIDMDIDLSKKFCQTAIPSYSSSNNGRPSLNDMLAMFSETERLKPEESWLLTNLPYIDIDYRYCNKCKEHVEATKRLVLYRLPPILIVQLKRFVYTASIMSTHRRSKDERPVEYPISSLDLKNFLCDTAPGNQGTVYDLVGVVCHTGSSYFGHYFSYGRLSGIDSTMTEIEWRNFDDSNVTRVTPSRVLCDDAYLLFYKQRGSPTAALLSEHYGISAS